MSTEKYESIINLPHHQSRTRPHMAVADRAAQFAPFAALSGHGEAIRETARRTEERRELTEEETAKLNRQTAHLLERLAAQERPHISVVYFLPDEYKEGGSCEEYAGNLRQIDEAGGWFIFEDGKKLRTRDILQIR